MAASRAGSVEPGRRLTDRLIAEHLDNERELLRGLSAAEPDRLGDLLGRLLRSLDPG